MSAPTARREEDTKYVCRLPGVQSLSFPGLPHWTLIPPAPSPHLRLHLLLSGDSWATRRAGPRALLVEVLRQSVSEPVGQRCLSPGSTSPLSLTKVQLVQRRPYRQPRPLPIGQTLLGTPEPWPGRVCPVKRRQSQAHGTPWASTTTTSWPRAHSPHPCKLPP